MKIETASQHLEKIEYIFNKYNRKKYINKDPLKFLYYYNRIQDREIVALISSSLAYGRVTQILKSISWILERMGPSPYYFIKNNSYKKMCYVFKNFNHRFANGKQMAALLFGVKKVLNSFNSLNDCFKHGFINKDILTAMLYFFNQLNNTRFNFGHLIPNPQKKSACKRLNLFLRWMIRCDEIDPGGWNGISLSKLIVPLDTHMHSIGLYFGFTKRRSVNIKTAKEITSGFQLLSPKDPVKYDFALTRIGILKKLTLSEYLN